ncbi:conserved hypothetical protein [Talaromyces stipitatus ATCC 10500]|uniref:DDE-1 domain-containing protein n=1 Tax=Talaromyces stipitatus (strain ATCC 10500 / CBS 375.48 / QM 6759 / NRRL 1006) TaxID=441959 RepID=B8LVB7_TALSN|nr:uncharacterized protein TSTA_066180 [Talaromyces stipitatus ATCC 10500]EED23167.1 conserved hypothetical protein [Talaromyces stipitatus ATCC 10500]
MAGQHVILLMDNFSAHEAAVKEVTADLKHTALWKQQWVRYIIDEFDCGIDPLSTMTILRAVRWAVNIWEDQVTSTTITNCFKKALHDETEEEFESALLIYDLENSLQDLKLTNWVQDVMDINQFLNSPDEQVNDTVMDIDNIVLSQFELPQTDELEEDVVEEPIPLITSQEAL